MYKVSLSVYLSELAANIYFLIKKVVFRFIYMFLVVLFLYFPHFYDVLF